MDPISASSFNLSTVKDDTEENVGLSAKSLSQYEVKNLKNLLPQIIAGLISCGSHLVVGISLSFSAVLIPQLQEATSDIQVTPSQTSWIASVLALIAPLGAILSGYLMDKYGRINTLKISVIPGFLGWVIMAVAPDVTTLIIGRIVSGLASSLSTSPAVVYLTEVSRKDMRGSLLSLGPAFVSLGMVVVLIKGWLLGWRAISWLNLIYVLIPFALLYLIPESPAWLVAQKRLKEAEESLQFFHKHQPPHNGKSFAKMQLEQLVAEQERNLALAPKTNFLKEFAKPTGYKPMIILTFLSFFQQFSGIYVFLFYSVNFFQNIGTSINPYKASIMIGFIRLGMSMGNTYLLKNFTRRLLIMLSACGMALCTLISAIYTKKIENGDAGEWGQWIPVIFLLLYVTFSMVGLLNIPWTMTAELFPLNIRSMAHSIATSIANFVMFIAIQNYLNMLDWFGGSDGVLLFFSGVCFCAIFFAFVFLPETHEKTLKEIQNYFKNNFIYIKCGKGKKEDEEEEEENNNRDRLLNNP